MLRDLGIEVIADMPGVGADLQDHLQIRMQYRCTEPITMNDVINNWRHRYAAGLRYLLSRKGLLTIGAGYAGAFPAHAAGSGDARRANPLSHLFSADAAGAALHPFPGFMASVCQLRPDSRGFVRIKSSDPAVPPAIQPRYLSARTDCDTVVAGLKLLRRIMNQPVMRRYIAEERAPGEHCASDADLLAFARNTGTTVYHPTSTCRMGSDPNAVVDERLRVRGFERLRVIDASIMPTVVSGNTNAAAVMIGEKGADMILEDAPVGAAQGSQACVDCVNLSTSAAGLPGGGPTALTLLPAVLSAVALVLGAAMGLVPGDFERRLDHLAKRSGRIGRLAARFATLPATLGSGVRTALGLIRNRHWGLLGVVAYWAFDIACLGASFKAFGTVGCRPRCS